MGRFCNIGLCDKQVRDSCVIVHEGEIVESTINCLFKMQ